MPRSVRVFAPALLVAVATVSALVGLAIGGGADPAPLADPGPIVRYGLPIAQMVFNLAAAATIGGLVMVCFALDSKRTEYEAALDFVSASAAVWTVTSLATGLLTFQSVYLEPITLDDRYGQLLASYLTTIPLGQASLVSTLIPAVVTVLCFALRNQTAMFFVTVLAASGLVPLALEGHAAGSSGHDMAVSSLGLHLEFVSIWLGGLLLLVAIHRHLGEGRLAVILSRYSTLALISFVVVAASGVANAQLRIGSWEKLFTAYGVLVILKTLALCVLGGFGAIQRKWIIRKIDRTNVGRQAKFWWFVLAELAVMGFASGIAAALARTRTPVPQNLITATPAYILTGDPLPPELTPIRYLTEWKFDILWILIVFFVAFFYLTGVRRLQKRGDRWPLIRTVSFLIGLAVLFYVTNGAVNAYEKYLFSVHMLAHMTLGMIIPVLLAPGAPITLALRAINKRSDGSRGVREWILLAVHSNVAKVMSRPVVAAIFFAGSLWVFYYSPLFRWATQDHIGHTFMIFHFLLSGYLFVQTLVGTDPLPYRAPYPMRLVILLATLAFHAFFGVTLMTGTGLLLADWYGAMGRPWGVDAITDQRVGGGIAWSIGEIPTLALAILVLVMWSRSDEKLAKRLDRKAQRDGDTELEQYNEMLARLQNRN